MIYLGLEGALGRLEGVVRGESNIQEKHSALVGGVRGAHNHSLPIEHVVVVYGTGRDGLRAILFQVCQFLCQTLLGHYVF